MTCLSNSLLVPLAAYAYTRHCTLHADYIHVTFTQTHLHTYTYPPSHMHTYIPSHKHTYTHPPLHIHTYTYPPSHIHTLTHLHTCTLMYLHTYIHSPSHMHTLTHTLTPSLECSAQWYMVHPCTAGEVRLSSGPRGRWILPASHYP